MKNGGLNGWRKKFNRPGSRAALPSHSFNPSTSMKKDSLSRSGFHSLAALAFLACSVTHALSAESEVAAEAVGSESDVPVLRIHETEEGGFLQTPMLRFEDGEGKRVDVFGAIHIAEGDYYRALNERFEKYDSVLYEMVKEVADEDGGGKAPGDGEDGAEEEAAEGGDGGSGGGAEDPLLQLLGPAYELFSRLLGLESQKTSINYEAENFVHADLMLSEFTALQREAGETLFSAAMEGGVDASEIDTAALLRDLFAGETSAVRRSFAGLMKSASLVQGKDSPEADGSVLIGARNERAIEVLEERLGEGDEKIAMFYGAAHLPDFVFRLREMGFENTDVDWLSAWSLGPEPRGLTVVDSTPGAPLLWKVSGGALEEPSWLFGTIHIGDEEVLKLHNVVVDALEGASELWTEIAMDAGAQAGAAQLLEREGAGLRESIGDELYAELETELAAIHPMLRPAAFERMATWAVAVSLPLLGDQMAGNLSLDEHLWNRGGEIGIERKALETVESQTRVLRELDEAEQNALLRISLTQMREAREEGVGPLDELRELYLGGDADALWQAVAEDFAADDEEDELLVQLGEKLLQGLLNERDEHMAKLLDEQFQSDPAVSRFVAVGAAHLVNPEGVPARLRAFGYEVERVEVAD